MKEEFIKILADYWPIIVSSVLSLVTTHFFSFLVSADPYIIK